MRVIICGGGAVGAGIAHHLSSEDNDVVVIDSSRDVMAQLAKNLDIQSLQGNAARPDVLEQARMRDADMLIAVTGSDEVNMVICQVAYTLFKTPVRIARIRDQHYLASSWKHLFQDSHVPVNAVISPEREVARAITTQLRWPGAFECIMLEQSSLAVVRVEPAPQSDWYECSVSEMEKKASFPLSILAYVRDGALQQWDRHHVLAHGEAVYVAVSQNQVTPLMRFMGHGEAEARRVLIIGGGNIGWALAEMLEERVVDLNLKVIEQDEQRAKKIAANLKEATVIHGDALDPVILSEAEINTTETIICVTQEDENNILISLLAKHHGCQKAIALVKNPIYHQMVYRLGMDVVVHPRSITVSSILRHVREGKVISVHSLGGERGELMELEILPTAAILDRSLAQLDLPPGVRIGAVVRDGTGVLMPHGEMVFQKHDRVVLLAPTRAIKDVERLFTAKPSFF